MRAALAWLCATAAAACPAAPAVDVFVHRRPTASEVAANFTAALHEPPYGCLIGAYIDQDASLGEPTKDGTGRSRRLPEPFERAVGKPHAGYFFYMGYGSRLPADWIGRLHGEGKVVHIALEPNNGLEYVRDDHYLRNLAEGLRQTGARVFLRFASEMNGPWVAYSGDATKYREAFRTVAKAMHERAPNVAMVWCPYAMPAGPIPRFYPGDDAVDWVGVNLYSVTYFNQDRRTPGRWVHPVDLLEPVYKRYAAKKPIMLGEYGAAHYSSVEKRSVSDFAVGCIRSLYSALPRRYPRVKAVFYFNGNNLDVAHRRNNNYAVTQDMTALEAYRSAVQDDYFLARWPEPTRLTMEGFRFSVEPVDGGPASAAPPISAMPLAKGEVLSGRVRLSVWAKDHLARYTLRLTVGGRPVLFGTVAQGWQGEVDTTQLPDGPAKVVAEVWSGRKVATRSTTVVQVEN
jgi:hypothetical protein